MIRGSSVGDGRAWGRRYFAAQALAGAAWWLAVFLLPAVREATLGALDPVAVAIADIPLFVVASALGAAGSKWSATVATVWTSLVAAALVVYATVTTLAGIGAVLMIGSAAASVVALSLVWTGHTPERCLLVGPLGPRTADPDAPLSRHVRATIVQIVVFWGLFLGVIPIVIHALEERWMLSVEAPRGLAVAGILLFLAASALGIWAAAVMSTRGAGTPLPSDTATRFVVSGPYRFVRNPMAIAGIVQGAAVGLALSSWLVVLYAVCGSLVWNYLVRPVEEADLEQRFGEPFRQYRSRVRCWWPRIRPVPSTVTPAVAASAGPGRSRARG